MIGAGSTAILIVADRLGRETLARHTDHGRALAEIQVSVATSHLWLEEYVTGDSVDLEVVQDGLDRSLALARRLAGGDRAPTQPWLTRLAEPRHRAASRLAWRIAEFRALSNERREGFTASRRVGVGSAIDVVYDAVFEELMHEARFLADDLEASGTALRHRSTTVFWGIMSTWVLLVGAVAFGVRQRELHRLRTEAALAASRKQLLQTQKLEVAGRVASGLAHDLNNYLAAIRGHCELARRKMIANNLPTKRMDGAIRVIEKSAGLISRLQAFAQTESSERTAVDANDVVDDVLDIVRPSLGERIRLRTDLSSQLWLVEVNREQFEQAIVNLLVNARDALAESRGGEIVVATRNVPKGRADESSEIDRVEVLVADDGPGIAPEIRERLFEPFATTRSSSSNSGLGLAIVYGFVRAHDGEVQAEPRKGRGARFRLLLPRTERAPTAEHGSVAVRASDVTGQERILVVDDHDELRETLAEILRAHGYEVTAVADAESALEVWSTAPRGFDLLLTDLVLPGIDGLQLVSRLRQESQLRAILMSGHRQEVVAKFAGREDEVFEKSSDFSLLLQEVRQQLDSIRDE